MTAPAWSAGPWLPVEFKLGKRSFWVATSRDGRLPEIEANARLIAAAPELFDACDVALAMLDNMTSKEFSLGGDRSVRELLRGALAKANGGTS